MTGSDETVFRTATPKPSVPIPLALAYFAVMLLSVLVFWSSVDWFVVQLLAAVAVVMGGMIYVLQLYVYSRHRDATLRVDAEGLALEGGRARRLVPWNEITRVVVTDDTAGRPVLVEADVRGGPKATMRWLERMDEVVTRIEAHLAAGTPVERKRVFWRLDNTVSWLVAVGVVAAALVYIYAIDSFVPAPYQSLVGNTVTVVFLSGLFLFGRPQSRSNPGMRRFELGMVALLVTLLLASYVLHFAF